MVIVGLFSPEAPLRSVNGIPRPTPSVGDAVAFPITNRIIPARLAAILLPNSENVQIEKCRRMGSEDPAAQGHWHWQDEIPQDCHQSLQKPNQGHQETVIVFLFKRHSP